MRARSLWVAVALTLLTTAVRADEGTELDQASRERVQKDLEQANQRLEQTVHEISELTVQLNGQSWTEFGAPRALLGINVGGPGRDNADSKTGVRVLSVSPGGPADVAGLRGNDFIVSFQGKNLLGDTVHSPRQQLLTLMREAHPGDPIAVEFQRGGKLQQAEIVPKPSTLFIDGAVNPFVQVRPDSPGPDPYVRAPKDQRLKLQDGDVILDIDGRTPTSGSHALQILNSYTAGETLKFHIMRQQRRLEVPLEIPADL
jgi:S1-C subfamily serine protease